MNLFNLKCDNTDLSCNWFYKLECLNGLTLYYDKSELYQARENKAYYGGRLVDRQNNIY